MTENIEGNGYNKQGKQLSPNSKFISILLDAIPIPIFYKDAQGIYLGCNTMFAQFLQRTKEEIIGQDVYGVSSPELAEIYQKQDTELFKHPGIQVYESQVKKADGSKQTVIFHKATFNNEDGSLGGIIGAILDITELKRTEEAQKASEDKFSNLFYNSPIPMSITSRTGRIVDVNEAGAKTFGSSREELIGHSTVELNYWFSPQERSNWVSLVLATGQQRDFKTKFRVRPDEVRDFLISSGVVEIDGEIVIITQYIDITASKKAEEKLRELYEKEKELREEKEKEVQARAMFIDILAHELKTPLTPILSSTELLKEITHDQPNELLSKIATNIHSAANNLDHCLADLLDMARYARGTFKLNPEPEDVHRFIDVVTARYKPTLDKAQQTLVTQIENDLPILFMDSSRLEQVITNLLSNASKFSPANSEIHLNVYRNQSQIHFDVIDHGIGISTEDQKTLFEPYHRVQNDNKKYPGTGLGLAICKQIISVHGGRIWVDSGVNRGSTFSFEIPIKEI